MIKIHIEKVNPHAIIPSYAKPNDAGMDIYASQDVTIGLNSTALVPTGIKVAIPPGYEMQIRPRSGLSLKTRLRVANSPGTIDSGYRDEVAVIIHNTSIEDDGVFDLMEKENRQGTYLIKKGDRIAQIVVQAISLVEFVEVEDVSSIGKNRGGGFGSTGTR